MGRVALLGPTACYPTKTVAPIPAKPRRGPSSGISTTDEALAAEERGMAYDELPTSPLKKHKLAGIQGVAIAPKHFSLEAVAAARRASVRPPRLDDAVLNSIRQPISISPIVTSRGDKSSAVTQLLRSPAGEELRRNCDYCVRKKVKCNGDRPCHMCRRKKMVCTYSVKQKPGPKVKAAGGGEQVGGPISTPHRKSHLGAAAAPSSAPQISMASLSVKCHQEGDDIEITEALLALKHSK